MTHRPRGAGRETLAALLVLFGLLLAFYWSNLAGFPGERKFFWEDLIEQNYPYRAFAAEEMRIGRLPFWNPYQFGGMPFVADIQAATFYPVNVALALFVTDGRLDPWWVEAASVLHALLGGFFLFLLVRSRTGSASASIFSGAAWALSGFFVVRMIHLNVLSVMAWAPLVLLLVILATERRSFSAAVLAGLALGVSLLGGSPQFSFYLLIPPGLYALVEVVRPAAGAGGGFRRLRAAGYLGVALLVGFGLAAVQLLPTSELSPLSLRAEMTYEKSTECSFGPASFPTLLMPHLYGSVAGRETAGYWGPGLYYYAWELCAYTGIVVLLLAGIAVLFSPWNRTTAFLLVVALFGLLLGLGGYGPLHPLFYKIVPIYGRFRCPGRALVLTGFALAALAGMGAHRLGGPPPPGRRKWGLGALAALLFAAGTIGFLAARPGSGPGAGHVPQAAQAAALRSYFLFVVLLAAAAAPLLAWAFGKRRLSGMLRWGLFGLLVAELFAYGLGFNDGDVDPIPYYRGDKAVLDLLRKETRGGLYRVKTRADEGIVLPRNMGSVNRVPSVDGYNQMKLQRYDDLQVSRTVPAARVLDLLGVRIYAAYDPTARGLRLTRNEDCLPKAFFVGEVEHAAPGPALIARLGSASFDPRTTVLLEGGGGVERLGGGGSATVTEWGPNRIVVDVDASGPGYLVLGEIAYPAWRARVDGRDEPSVPADHALRAVRMEGGRHTVVWEYRSATFRAGLVITLATLAGAALLLFVVGPRRGDGVLDACGALRTRSSR